mgnify:CR=1 FL=1
MTADDLFRVVEEHARDGVDFMTIHAGMNRETAQHVRKNPRITSSFHGEDPFSSHGCTAMGKKTHSMNNSTGFSISAGTMM